MAVILSCGGPFFSSSSSWSSSSLSHAPSKIHLQKFPCEILSKSDRKNCAFERDRKRHPISLSPDPLSRWRRQFFGQPSKGCHANQGSHVLFFLFQLWQGLFYKIKLKGEGIFLQMEQQDSKTHLCPREEPLLPCFVFSNHEKERIPPLAGYDISYEAFSLLLLCFSFHYYFLVLCHFCFDKFKRGYHSSSHL